MKITVIAVGKLKEQFLKDGVGEYVRRLSRFCDLEMVEVDDEQAPDSQAAALEVQIKKREAARIQKKLKDGSFLIVLDIDGKKMSSEEFAGFLQACFAGGKPDITFAIGGTLGLDPGLSAKAGLRLSLSDMTFPHQLARLVLLEQLYRAFKIMRGEPYHR